METITNSNDTMANRPKYKVLFVCLGNICRSPAAEGVMRAVVARHGAEADWLIDSAGTGDYHIGDLPDRRMRIAARRRGYELTHRCRQVKPSDFDDFDLIIGMDNSNLANLRRLARTVEDAAKVQPMARWLDPGAGYDYVPDPYYEGAQGFELVLDQLEYGCERLYQEMSNSKH